MLILYTSAVFLNLCAVRGFQVCRESFRENNCLAMFNFATIGHVINQTKSDSEQDRFNFIKHLILRLKLGKQSVNVDEDLFKEHLIFGIKIRSSEREGR